MKILQIHNKYRHYGGEDVVVDNEYNLLKNNGFEVNQLLFSNEKISPSNLFHSPEAFQTTLNKIDDFNPDVIHVHNIFYSASPSVLKAAKKRNIPVVMTLHNYRLLCPGALFLRDSKVCTKCKNISIPYYGIKHKCFQNSYMKSALLASFIGYNKIAKTWSNTINKFIVLTPFIKKLIVDSSLKIKDTNIVVKPNSTDDLLNVNILERKNKYLFIGRLSKEKGVNILIEAFNKISHIQLDVIGDGELFDELKNTANKNIIFHGAKDKAFISEMLSQTRALVFPSIWYEGLPNTLIEAFSAGTPVLASNIDNINDIVISGYNGETFSPNNPIELVEKVLEFSNKETKQYGINARKLYEKMYTHQKNFENLKDLYSKLN
ncbi:glycosyltransferase family 4 protein [uncultured Algibacter sp.]|uniref:glycosyltransferase family 4 protein n=1 Tax=uncultured Algibacter sp. TaxID=298659 RepID=UPI0030ED6A4D|tara:strand:- start:2022 stop:3152 length:1131 start_codon:yes stop_codon:yes gene_type:complete